MSNEEPGSKNKMHATCIDANWSIKSNQTNIILKTFIMLTCKNSLMNLYVCTLNNQEIFCIQ